MPFHLFQYPLPAHPELDDLNAFLASNRVARVTQNILPAETGSMLLFIVETVASGPPRTSAGGAKTDYRELLSSEEFALFSQLRTIRKQIADAEGVPVYTILSNAQLAELVKQRATTPAAMAAIDGVGAARVEKDAAKLLPAIAAAFPPPSGDGT